MQPISDSYRGYEVEAVPIVRDGKPHFTRDGSDCPCNGTTRSDALNASTARMTLCAQRGSG
jgi:hypothetical protein